MYIIKTFNAYAKVLVKFVDIIAVIALTSVSAVDGPWGTLKFRGKQNSQFPVSRCFLVQWIFATGVAIYFKRKTLIESLRYLNIQVIIPTKARAHPLSRDNQRLPEPTRE